MLMSSGAVNEAVMHRSTAGGGILHYISPGALDGFAIGALLSGLILLVMVPRLLRRAQPDGLYRDYFATPADGGPFAAALAAAQERAAAGDLDDFGDADTDSYDTDELGELSEAEQIDATPDDAAEADATPDDQDEVANLDDDVSLSGSGRSHRSKHRLSARPVMSAWRIDVRRGQPRHAARSAALSTRM